MTETFPGYFPPTEEQKRLIDLFKTGENLVVQAGAGTGKTSTLLHFAYATDRRGQYVAFNRSIVKEAGTKFPAHVACSTAHSLAMRAVGNPFRARMQSGKRMRTLDIANRLKIDGLNVKDTDGNTKHLSRSFLAGIVMDGVRRFCQSADTTPTAWHIPYVEGLDPPGARRGANNRFVAQHLEGALTAAWKDLSSVEGGLPFTTSTAMAVILKLWQLSNPKIGADFILYDEAQDASPVMLAVVLAQTHAQLVFVGDSQQCQPPGSLVTVIESYRRGNRYSGVQPTTYKQIPIEDVQEGDRVLSFDITKSFLRRQGSLVTETAARRYEGDLVDINANGHRSSYTPEHRCVVRIGEALERKWCVYMMRRGNSFRIGTVRGIYQTQAGSLGLPMRLAAEQADDAWVLSTHDDESDARRQEATVAWHSGIPTLRFRQQANYGISQEDLDLFWDDLGDLSFAAERLLRLSGRLINHPICQRGRRLYRRRSQLVVAANLLDGMLVLTQPGAFDAEGKQVPKKRWSAVTVSRRSYSGQVHSLRISETETYIGDGIVTHNSIYRFTGAVDALDRLDSAGAKTGFLTQSFRFGPAIADVANHVLAQIDGAVLRLVGTDSIGSIVAPIIQPDAVLCRTNAAAVETVLRAQQEDVSVHLVGGGAEVVNFTRAARDLMDGRRTEHPELACFESWEEVQHYVSEDEQGGDLRLMVSLIDRFTVEVILTALASQVKEADADLVVSTAHKAKGREWGRVQLAGDFPEDKIAGNTDELRLLYVAVTRAQRELDITAIPFLRDGYVPVVKETVQVSAEPVTEEPVEAQVEVVETKPSEWVGSIGETLERTARVERAVPLTTAYGDTFLCTLVDDATGTVFKSFVNAGLPEGRTVRFSARVKGHGDYQGIKETTLNYLSVLDVLDAPAPVAAAPTPAPEPAPEAAAAFVDDGEPF